MTTIAITGASGNLGRATLKYLFKRGVAPLSIVPVVRDLAKARDLDAPGSHVRCGNYADAASLESAFSRIDTLLFISSSSLGEERNLHHTNVVNAARSAGVAHIIYTSVVKPSASAKFPASPGHLHTEQLIRESGIPCTLFRNNLYSDIVPVLFAGATETGVLTHCAGHGRVGFVARDDIAAALAGVLARGDRPGRVYSITARGVDQTPHAMTDRMPTQSANRAARPYAAGSPEGCRCLAGADPAVGSRNLPGAQSGRAAVPNVLTDFAACSGGTTRHGYGTVRGHRRGARRRRALGAAEPLDVVALLLHRGGAGRTSGERWRCATQPQEDQDSLPRHRHTIRHSFRSLRARDGSANSRRCRP
jgi:NAD(P)H dehydrogenase (quinone)